MKIAFCAAAAMLASPAIGAAQEAAPAQAQPSTQAQAQAQAVPASSDISDQEVSQFALAALMVSQIAEDETVPQENKQGVMMNAVAQAGLEPRRFNQIAVASRSDTELSERIQLAANEHIAAAQAAQ